MRSSLVNSCRYTLVDGLSRDGGDRNIAMEVLVVESDFKGLRLYRDAQIQYASINQPFRIIRSAIVQKIMSSADLASTTRRAKDQ